MTIPFHREARVTLHIGDCVEVMRDLDPASVDAIVTDPPYGLEFMGKEWDRLDAPAFRREQRADEMSDPVKAKYLRHSVEYVGGASAEVWHKTWATEALRVMKPGGHLVAFGGTRTFHRLTCALEDAGFEIRDCLMWLYGSGFPKSLDVSKAMDKAAGIWRGRAGEVSSENGAMAGLNYDRTDKGEPATDAARAWAGWGTALKPAWEPIVLARKPLGEANVAANVLAHRTGALNVDGGRIGTQARVNPPAGNKPGGNAYMMGVLGMPTHADSTTALGRWPANLVLDDEAARQLDEQSGELSPGHFPAERGAGGIGNDGHIGQRGLAEAWTERGGASRFFYTAKADREDRDGSKHPTVKPTDLMRWLITLVTPPGGLVLDPFMGSGPTIWAAREYGFRVIGIDREREYAEDALRRLRQGVLPL